MRCGARLFAVYTDEIEATSENLTPTPLPFAPPPVRGVVGQRGRILTVIDPLLLFPDASPSAPAPAPPSTLNSVPLIVALKGDEQLALGVESIESELLHVAAHEHADADSLLRRTIRHGAESIALLDPARLFDAAMQGVDRRRRRS
jgi:chemotaxis signal transduction protein